MRAESSRSCASTDGDLVRRFAGMIQGTGKDEPQPRTSSVFIQKKRLVPAYEAPFPPDSTLCRRCLWCGSAMCTVCRRARVRLATAQRSGETRVSRCGQAACVCWSMPIRVRFVWKMASLVRRRALTLGDLFAMCPYDITGKSVEAVLDSSRYFVLRVEHDDGETKRHAYIGVGVCGYD